MIQNYTWSKADLHFQLLCSTFSTAVLQLLFALASCCLGGISPSIQCFLAEFHFQPLRAIRYTAQSVKDNFLRWISLSTVENVDLPWPLLTHRLCGIAIRHRQCSMVKRVIPEIMLGQSKFSLDILLSKLSRLRELPRLCTFESMLSSVSKPLVLETMAWSSSFFMVSMQATLFI